MISFNQTHFNLKKIQELAGINRLVTKKHYRIYGLKQDRAGEKITLKYNQYSVDSLKMQRAIGCIEDKGISLYIDGEDYYRKIRIGLRRDIRDNPKLCVAVIKTIIFAIEGKIDWDNTSTQRVSAPVTKSSPALSPIVNF